MNPLLNDDEPAPFAVENTEGKSPLLLICEHGGMRIPARLGTLGLAEEHLGKHFVLDIGALELSRSISRRLDAVFVHQRYSRLVCDCNRSPDSPDFAAKQGEGIPVPLNDSLSPEEHDLRRRAIWQPFQDGLTALLDGRDAAGQETIVVSIHSFTPVFHGQRRHMNIGVLFDKDRVFSPLVFSLLKDELNELVEENSPYSMSRQTDYTIPIHGEDRGLHCVELEFRNDLITKPKDIAKWSELIADMLRLACKKVGVTL